MKKVMAALMLAAMILATGCGNTMDGAKKDAQEAAQKADEVKKDATAKVDEAKDKANEVKDEAAAKVDEVKDKADEVKDEAAAKVDEVKSDAAEKLEEVTADITEATVGRTVALSGVMPGSSIEDVQTMFGEATATEGNVITFVNGLKVTLDDAKKVVKAVSTTGADFDTPEGIYVGASEYALNDYCGPADAVRQISGGTEYEYNSGDKKSKVVYKTQNGVIAEITCSLK